MTMRIDHIVVRVQSLDAAITEYEQRGFTVTRGGQHPDFCTHNALIPFTDDSYLELIARVPNVEPPPATTTPARRVALWREAEGGVVDWALLPDDMDSTIVIARSQGIEIDGPYFGRRTRPDGNEVAWSFAFPPTMALPFLCADVTPRPLRVPDGSARVHANGATGIRRVTLTTPDVSTTATGIAALSGGDAVPRGDGLSFAIGDSEVLVIAGAIHQIDIEIA